MQGCGKRKTTGSGIESGEITSRNERMKGQRNSTVARRLSRTSCAPPGRERKGETRFHGLRVGGLRRAAAPPVATARGPFRGQDPTGELRFVERVALLALRQGCSPVPVLAPRGRRTVATGGAKSADRRTERNPWKSASILDPA